MNRTGFTLLEILIALAIFAILAGLTSSILYYAFNVKNRVSAQAARLDEIEFGLTLMQRDFKQMASRPIHLNEQEILPSIVGEAKYVEFTTEDTTRSKVNPKLSNLKRVAYRCQDQQLTRLTWKQLDHSKTSRPQTTNILSAVESCHFDYIDESLQLLSHWQAHALRQNLKTEASPKAIRLTVKLQDWGELILFLPSVPTLYVGIVGMEK